eukprot:TRINITY_DN12681_c1_g1_i1.p1 TRINITY_DN12681_c1_g1~~TRINITY_DN12681_c1_g1_i1.p1  ORF type:complete len:113 (+),score=15.87 TRINITY_DN12681_c1_g1_i1:56-394(+)
MKKGSKIFEWSLFLYLTVTRITWVTTTLLFTDTFARYLLSFHRHKDWYNRVHILVRSKKRSIEPGGGSCLVSSELSSGGTYRATSSPSSLRSTTYFFLFTVERETAKILKEF